MSTRLTRIIALLTVFAMLFSAEVFAGKGSHCHGKKKHGFFAKVGAAIKNTAKKVGKAAKCVVVKTGKAVKNVAKKTGKAIKTAVVKTGKAIKVSGAKINNAVKDSGVWIKWKLTGKKNRVWVVGHYDKNGKWIKGHWRKLTPKEAAACGGGNHPGQGNYPGQGNDPGQSEPLPMPPGEEPPADLPSDDAGQTPDAPPADVPSDDAGQGDAGQTPDAPPADVPSDDAGQGDDNQAPEDPVLPELPPEEPPTDAPPAEEPPAEEPPAEEPPAEEPPAEEPPAEEPPAEEPPADQPSDESEQSGQSGQSGQTSQDSEQSDQASQSGDAAQVQKYEDEEVSLRTLGMLMNDIVTDSREITKFKSSAYADPNMNFSMEVHHEVNGRYESREQNAALLVKVIVYDLNLNNGKPGKYFSFFTHKLDSLDGESRKLISDVIKQVKDGVQHNSNHADNDKSEKAFAERMKDLNNY